MTASAGPLPFREFFALDVRSLALFRACLAVLLLLDWAERLPDLGTFYADAGLLPRAILRGEHPVSVMLLSGGLAWQAFVAVLAFGFGLMLLVGWLTPLAAFASYVLLLGAHGRNPLVLHGADHLLRALLFWGIFLPLGACWSVDARQREQRPASPVVRSFASFALIAQLAIVYLFAAAWKWGDEWRRSNDAVYLALGLDAFSTRFGQWLRGYPDACRLLTQASVWLETFGPALLFLPFHVGLQRLVAVFLFAMFHCGLALALELGLFPFVACAGWLAVLPSSFWDRLERKLPRLAVERPTATAGEPAWRPPAGLVPTAFAMLCFAYVVLSNVRTLTAEYQNPVAGAPLAEERKSALNRFAEDLMPDQLMQFGRVSGLDQNWGVFAPSPARWGGWFLAIATLADGSRVELLRGGDPDDRRPPEQQQATYRNSRWRTYVLNMAATGLRPNLLPGYAEWAVREWRRAHGPERRIVSIEFLWMRLENRGPDEPPATPEEVRLAYWKEPAR